LQNGTSNFRDVNWEEFCKILQEKIATFSIPRKIYTQVELE
jgi:hypothetical protein